MKKETRKNFIPPSSIRTLLKHNNNIQGNENKGGKIKLTAAIKVLQQGWFNSLILVLLMSQEFHII